MARYFNGATHVIKAGSALVTPYPSTIACWFKLDNNNDLLDHNLFGLYKSSGGGTDQGIYLDVDNRSTNAKKLALVANDANNWNPALASALINTGWNHGLGVNVSSTSRTIWLNGGNSSLDATSRNPSVNDTWIGAYAGAGGGSPSSNVGHQVAECAIWNVALTSAEIAALAKGVLPRFVRPSALVSYAPLLFGQSPENDIVNRGVTWTVTGATQVNHAPVLLRP